MAYGKTIILATTSKDNIISHLRSCGCTEKDIAECWRCFIQSVEDVCGKLKKAAKTGIYTHVEDMARDFLELVKNLDAVDLAIYAEEFYAALRNNDANERERVIYDLIRNCEKYLAEPALAPRETNAQ